MSSLYCGVITSSATPSSYGRFFRYLIYSSISSFSLEILPVTWFILLCSSKTNYCWRLFNGVVLRIDSKPSFIWTHMSCFSSGLIWYSIENYLHPRTATNKNFKISCSYYQFVQKESLKRVIIVTKCYW